MRLAFLFPGQGSQKPEFLNELQTCAAVENVLETVTDLLGKSVYKLDSKEALASTKAVQLSLLIAGVATFKAFEAEGVKPDFVAGHSVGAFSAAVAAGVIELKDALKIVKLRGELMEQAYPEGYGMGVILGMEFYKLQSLVSYHFDEKYPVFIANQNALDQITISGALHGIQKVLDDARQNGARCASMLNVNTPSHCQLLSSVSDALTTALHNIKFHDPVIPYAGNRRARLLSDPVDIRLDLAESVSSPVQWHDASTVLYEKGARLFIEMPPGNVLSRLAAKAFPDARVLSVAENGFDNCQFIAKLERLKR
ncbi:malonate decarboxylase subunit epsilon [Metabacillus sediminilitoris]|uniref:Malonyl CoA-acyl carrier protein transacylase n=1 Tax=Metabacillus sediminilitoris TaxID=2567941 RepID=A0A4S4BRK4_9BACI|nr:malonate decarboxylase subunit epsilon [Metabacillus sediminilitoris]QGQ45495.1 malonate decarboxylase subunit epsilon [Metabacillus sediminilitoris]THF77648.1 malonate decarboxylase subunit epsilon [Metabacillus sediminilitoris]